MGGQVGRTMLVLARLLVFQRLLVMIMSSIVLMTGHSGQGHFFAVASTSVLEPRKRQPVT